MAGLRFLFKVTLDRPDLSRRLVSARDAQKLPTVPSVEEVGPLLEAARGPKDRAALGVAYRAGRGGRHRLHKAPVHDLLFRAASESVLTIAADPRHLGARIGITAVLHTGVRRWAMPSGSNVCRSAARSASCRTTPV